MNFLERFASIINPSSFDRTAFSERWARSARRVEAEMAAGGGVRSYRSVAGVCGWMLSRTMNQSPRSDRSGVLHDQNIVYYAAPEFACIEAASIIGPITLLVIP